MPTSAAGNDRAAARRLRTLVSAQRLRQPRSPRHSRGLTLLEMLVVLSIMGIAMGGVAWTLRDTDHDRLEQQAVRLQAQLEVARALARTSASTARLRWLPDGYAIEGLPDNDTALQQPQRWMDARITAHETDAVVLGPEPMGAPWRIELSLGAARLALVSDGWSPVTIE